jgi:hypothetical protein
VRRISLSDQWSLIQIVCDRIIFCPMASPLRMWVTVDDELLVYIQYISIQQWTSIISIRSIVRNKAQRKKSIFTAWFMPYPIRRLRHSPLKNHEMVSYMNPRGRPPGIPWPSAVLYETFKRKVTAHELSNIAIERFQGETLGSPVLASGWASLLSTDFSPYRTNCGSHIGGSKPPFLAWDRLLTCNDN